MKKTFMKLTSVLFVAVLGLWSTDAQAGCNDIAACNYVSTDVDALDCDYGYELAVGGGTFDSEMSWNLLDGTGAVIASGLAPEILTLCLADDCYQIEMIDSFGDGWNGGSAVLTDNNTATVLFTSTFTTGTGPEYANWVVGTPACAVPGCDDPGACNYDSLANQNDGTCEYLTCAGCVDPAFCEFDSTATISDPAQCLTTFGCTDSLNCLYDPLAACGDQLVECAINPLDLCVDALDLGSVTTTVNINTFATCVDEDAGETGGIWVKFTTPAGPSIISFDMNDDGFGFWDNQIQVMTACPADGGTYDVNGDAIVDFQEGFGDFGGINGYFSLTFDCDVLLPSTEYVAYIDGFLGALGSGDLVMTVDEITCISGCTNALAINYDSTALLDDGTCVVADCTPDPATQYTYCYGNGLVNEGVLLFESSNPGVDNVVLQFIEGTIESNTFETITIYDGLDNTAPVLYTNAGLGSVDLGSNDTYGFPAENVIVESTGDFIYIELSSDGSVSCETSTNYIPWVMDVYCGIQSIAGCTDSTACNFDSMANLEDGSCCFDQCITLTVGGGTFDTEIAWTLTSWDTGVVVGSGGAPFSDAVCLVDGCYLLDMVDTFGDGWNGATYTFTDGLGTVLATGDLDTAPDGGDGVSTGLFLFDLGATGTCPVFGCVDSTACNFDSLATDDDGSCCFENCVTIDLSGGLNDFDIFWFLEASDGTNALANPNEFAPYNEDLCLADDCYTLRLLSSFGNGWVGGAINITDETGAILYTGDFDSGEGDGGYLSLHLFSVGGTPCATCQDPNACNFDSTGIYNDCDACEYTTCAGCTYAFASNFDPAASFDDGSCLPPVACPGDADGNGTVNILDIVAVSSNFGSSCF